MVPLVRSLDSYGTGDYLTSIIDQVFGTQARKMIGALRKGRGPSLVVTIRPIPLSI